MLQTLIAAVKVGVVGGGLAFLWMSYRLLSAETKRKGAARSDVLKQIGRFTTASLLFFIVAILVEFLTGFHTQLANAFDQLTSGDAMVRVRFNDWEFAPDDQKVGFAFVEDRRVSGKSYVFPNLKDDYNVYIGARKKSATPYDQGKYGPIFGPYRLANQAHVEQALGRERQIDIGDDGCLEFVAFGIPKAADEFPGSKSSFDVSERGVVVFHSASVCKTPSK